MHTWINAYFYWLLAMICHIHPLSYTRTPLFMGSANMSCQENFISKAWNVWWWLKSWLHTKYWVINNPSSVYSCMFEVVYLFLSTRLCHLASLAAVSPASPRCDSGRPARSRAKGLQAPRARAGAGLCVYVWDFWVHIYSHAQSNASLYFASVTCWQITSPCNYLY